MSDDLFEGWPLDAHGRPKGVVGRGKVSGIGMGNRERLALVAREEGLPEDLIAQACARVFPNGERKYDNVRVLEVARELMRETGE